MTSNSPPNPTTISTAQLEISTTHSSPTGSPTTPATTTVTTPEQSPTDDNAHDDIWASDSDHEASHQPTSSSTGPALLSDIPTLRRQHMTTGYREGLSVGKARVIQAGFDAGYPIGIALALRAGVVIGTLEGVVAALRTDPSKKSEAEKLLGQANAELAVAELMRGVDDAALAEMKIAQDGTAIQGLPRRIEEVLIKWERLAKGLVTS